MNKSKRAQFKQKVMRHTESKCLNFAIIYSGGKSISIISSLFIIDSTIRSIACLAKKVENFALRPSFSGSVTFDRLIFDRDSQKSDR